MKVIKTYSVTTEEGLKEPARELMARLSPGDWVSLEGELGAGKTTFVRYCLKHIGYVDSVPSPTYPLLLEYEVAPRKIIHIDGFRLAAGDENLWDFHEWKSEILFVEWAEKTNLPESKFKFHIQIKVKGETEREMIFFSL